MKQPNDQEEQELDRINFRLKAEDKLLIELAAARAGCSVTQFAKQVLLRRANKILQRKDLSDSDRELFFQMMDRPPEPNPALRQAVSLVKAQKFGPTTPSHA
jgi:uncharacterized protein (DUF1778 family)